METYFTRYPPGEGGSYGHWIWAKNIEKAEEICKKLQLIEPMKNLMGIHHIVEMRASKLIQLPGGICRGDVGHSIAFLSFLAVRAGADPLKMLHDHGAIHVRAHALHISGGSEYAKNHWLTKTIQAILDLEALVPGLPPDSVSLRVLEGEVPSSYYKAVTKADINKFKE